MTLTEMKRAAFVELAKIHEKAFSLFSYEETPYLEFSNRLRVCAGKAYWKQNRIELSIPIMQANFDDFIYGKNSTLGHEYVHILANRRENMNCGHSAIWKRYMMQMGYNTERCHNYQTKRNVVKRHNYACVKCSKMYEVSTRFHNKYQKLGVIGRCKILCRDCGSSVVYISSKKA